MNERFYSLPEEKQQAIINSGYHVFSQNSYKKSPMSEIAAAAGISKALLFHYFTNKRELYLFLYEKSGELSNQYLKEYGVFSKGDLFDIMLTGLKAKVHVMRKYPDLSAFVLKVFYEKDEEVCQDIHRISEKLAGYKVNSALLKIDHSNIKDGIDLQLMYQEMYWATEGYLFEQIQSGKTDVDRMEQDFTRLFQFWKKLYLKGDENGSN